ncbi:hypothetical protein FACS1894139_04610 [Planctomycetales bacterium]|nr:hypothetical protein FACS1894107_09110 [Planctomycetales bacterium]GHS99041.1 hypothetical protein FACS1894108_08290 [Planctomycetales bacterium]GHT03698.1 hypothetical protein FACS1894139_04610 [Planctomycetales bacterium]
MSDDMSAENSPGSPGGGKPRTGKPRTGKRVNSIPLVFVVGAVAIFCIVMLITMFTQHQRRSADATIGVKNSADGAAQDLIQNLGKIREKKPETKKEETVPAVVGNAPVVSNAVNAPVAPIPAPVIDQDMARLRSQKIQHFQSALASPLRVSLNAEYTKSSAERNRAAAIPTIGQQGFDANAKNNVVGGAVTAGLDRGATSAIAGADAPSTRYILRTGSVIPAMLVGGINSDLPGQIIGQVSQNVYDTPTGKHLLIPQGSRLIGEYASETKWGQNRVFAVWQRIIFPDGKAIDLGAFPMSSGAGYAGAKDKVDNHFFRIFGTAALMSFVVAGIEYSQKDISGGNNNSSSSNDSSQMSQTMSEALGQTLGQAMVKMLRKNMNINPTLIIRPGYRLNIMPVKDLEFQSAYKAFDFMAKLKP